MRQFACCVAAAFAFAFSFAPDAVAQRQDPPLGSVTIGALAVDVRDDDAEFEVIDARMDETATATVLFGLVGGAINSAANNSEDAEAAAPLVPTANEIDLDGLIRQAITERLAEQDATLLAATPETAANTLLVEIGEWGLVRRAQAPDVRMRVFLKLNVSILDARGRRIWGPQREHSIGQMTAEIRAFTPEVFRAEVEALAARAGRQVANRLIYR